MNGNCTLLHPKYSGLRDSSLSLQQSSDILRGPKPHRYTSSGLQYDLQACAALTHVQSVAIIDKQGDRGLASIATDGAKTTGPKLTTNLLYNALFLAPMPKPFLPIARIELSQRTPSNEL